jgi:hypothetical protein
LDLVALMIDGVHFADHLCVVALGIDIDGTKHPLALVEGSTENTTLVRGLIVGLRERGPGHHQAGPGRAGRRQGPGRRRQRGVRPPGDRSVPDPLRQYFPKGTDLRAHSVEDLRQVEERLHTRPRKTLK